MISRFADEIERIFEDFSVDRGWVEQSVWSPRIEFFEREDQLVVRADLPGLKREGVKVDITDNCQAIMTSAQTAPLVRASRW